MTYGTVGLSIERSTIDLDTLAGTWRLSLNHRAKRRCLGGRMFATATTKSAEGRMFHTITI